MAALNLEILRQFTMGEPDLDREILGLFRENAWLYLTEIETGDDWRRAAHSLKGSARGVGAETVAEMAERVEKAAGDTQPGGDMLSDLQQAVAEVDSLISRHLEQLPETE